MAVSGAPGLPSRASSGARTTPRPAWPVQARAADALPDNENARHHQQERPEAEDVHVDDAQPPQQHPGARGEKEHAAEWIERNDVVVKTFTVPEAPDT